MMTDTSLRLSRETADLLKSFAERKAPEIREYILGYPASYGVVSADDTIRYLIAAARKYYRLE